MQCGGKDSIDVYVNSKFKYAATKSFIADSRMWHFHNSYKTAVGAVGSATDAETLETCAPNCASYAFFGVKYETPYRSKCYCFSSVSGIGTAVTDSLGIPCGEDSAERCGGLGSKGETGIIDVYKAWSYYGYTTVGTITVATSISSTMTVNLCATSCSTYTYFGVRDEKCNCYSSNSGITQSSSLSGTSIPCSGDSNMRCGGESGTYVFDVYQKAS